MAVANQVEHPLYFKAGAEKTERTDEDQDDSQNDEVDGTASDQHIDIDDVINFWSSRNVTDERRQGVIAGQRYDADDKGHQAQRLHISFHEWYKIVPLILA